MEDLLHGGVICTELDEQVIFEQLGRKRGAVWSLMLASGYLKVDRYEMDKRTGKRRYYLKITNHETMLMFENMIEDWFTEEESAYGNFKEALLAGDLYYMNQFINQKKCTDHHKGNGSREISIFTIICFGSSHCYFPPNLLIWIFSHWRCSSLKGLRSIPLWPTAMTEST